MIVLHGPNMGYTEELKAAAKAAGADLIGVADLASFKAGPTFLPPGTFERFAHAISVAVKLDDTIIDTIEGAPTAEYAQHYDVMNAKLEEIIANLSKWIGSRGFSAFAISAIEIMDMKNLYGAISHKAVARLAGIGWQGKCLLIISPQYGPRIRLATLLTDMPLTHDKPLRSKCGTCNECSNACPSSAITKIDAQDCYPSREHALDFRRCTQQMLAFKAKLGLGIPICGVCVKVCPFGRRRKRTEMATGN